MRYLLCLPLFVMLLTTMASADELVVKYANSLGREDPRQDYFLKLLKLALNNTRSEGGDFRLELHPTKMLQSRAMKLLSQSGQLTVTWSMTSKQREVQALPVRIPILKGLLGFRVLMIHEQNKARFSQIKTREQLAVLSAGQGRDWPDTAILRSNQFKVQTAPTHSELFNMLHAKRFDYFPRGVFEAFGELTQQRALNKPFLIDTSMIIYYRSPVYYFVSMDNQPLADRIEKGLRLAIEQGTRDQLLDTFIQGPAKQLLDNIKNSTVIELHNPLLPRQTPVGDASLWYPM